MGGGWERCLLAFEDGVFFLGERRLWRGQRRTRAAYCRRRLPSIHLSSQPPAGGLAESGGRGADDVFACMGMVA